MLPICSLKGSPREIGRQYGTSCQDKIHKNIDLYFRVFKHYANLDKSQAIQLAKLFVPVIQSFDGDLLEEMKGIAEGAKAAFEEILAINVRTELMYPDQLAQGRMYGFGRPSGSHRFGRHASRAELGLETPPPG